MQAARNKTSLILLNQCCTQVHHAPAGVTAVSTPRPHPLSHAGLNQLRTEELSSLALYVTLQKWEWTAFLSYPRGNKQDGYFYKSSRAQWKRGCNIDRKSCVFLKAAFFPSEVAAKKNDAHACSFLFKVYRASPPLVKTPLVRPTFYFRQECLPITGRSSEYAICC